MPELELKGIYQGKNLFVQNPFLLDKPGFCVTEVMVNGKRCIDETQSSVFEIDFRAQRLKITDAVSIVIKHKDGCTPKVLNPEVIKPKTTSDG